MGRIGRTGRTGRNTAGAPAATLRRGQAKPRRSVSVSSRWGWGPSASVKKTGGMGTDGPGTTGANDCGRGLTPRRYT